MLSSENVNVLIVYPLGNALNPCTGAETRVWSIISSLVGKKINVSILHSIKSRGVEDIKLKKKCKVFYFKDLSFLGLPNWYISDLNPFLFIKLFKIIRKQKFDIIQVESPWGFLITKLLAKKKTFLIYDSLGVESEFIKVLINYLKLPKFFILFARIFVMLYEKLVCKLANAIIILSNVDRNYYIDKYKIKKNKTILIQTPSAINLQSQPRTEDLQIKSREKLGLPKNKTIAIFHGSLPHHPNKQALDLIETFIGPGIDNPNILFVLAGNNVKKFKKDNIISLGFVKNLKDLLYAADFAIVPIISGGGMRIKITDYIITGLPFITTKKGIEGIDFLKAGKDYFESNNVNNEFLKMINLLHSEPELREKLHKNLLLKSNKLTSTNCENRLNKLYLKLLGQ